MNSSFPASNLTLRLTASLGALLITFSPALAISKEQRQFSSSSSNTQILASAEIDNTVKSPTEINEIAHKTTLFLATESGSIGSGSLIAQEGNTCIGVTNRHVVLSKDGKVEKLGVRTYDNQLYQVNEVIWFQSEDLAVVKFQCTKNYETVTIATYQLSPGQTVYLSGWPPSLGTISRQFTSGSISTIKEKPKEGYSVGYTNVTQGGMSGGQVLDDAGRLVAIHGVGALDSEGYKTGFNYGIPVSTLLARLSQNGLNHSYQISYASPQEPANGDIAQSEPVSQSDSRDQINVNNVIDKVDRMVNIVCRIFGC